MSDDTSPTRTAVTDAPAPPVLRIISPDATPEEIATIVALLAASRNDAPPPPGPRPAWAAPARGHRTSLATGPGGWRASSLPR